MQTALETQESATCTVYPIVTCLDKADDVIGTDRQWHAVNEEQATFKRIFDNTRQEARGLKEIESISSRKVEVLNKFLSDRGFDIALDPFENPDTDFGMASVLDLLVEWLKEGRKIEIISGRDLKSHFPGVALTEGVSFFRSKLHNNPVARIDTKSGDAVYMTVDERQESFNLLFRIDQLSKSLHPVYEFKDVHFPQVDLDQKVNIGWMKKLWTTADDGDHCAVAQALQQTKFRMNEKGARAESAVAISIAKMATSVQRPRPPLVIDKPFLVWISREGFTHPLFTGWISEENWKTPKDISEK